MKNKRKIQIFFFTILLIGIGLSLFRITKPFGYLLLYIIQPIIALFYLSIFKLQEKSEDRYKLILRYPFLLMLQITFVSLCFQRMFLSMHWPFAGPMNVLAFGLTIITLLIAILYIILNRKVIQSVFVIEFVILSMPILLFTGIYFTSHVSKIEFKEVLNQEYKTLNQIKYSLCDKSKNDTSIDLSLVNTIEKIKTDAIDRSGGVNEDKLIIGSLHELEPNIINSDLIRLNEDGLAQVRNDKLLQCRNVIDYLNTLTKIQIEILLDNIVHPLNTSANSNTKAML